MLQIRRLRRIDAPVCALGLVQTKSVPRNGQVELACEVYADPLATTFRWYLNNSSETLEITANSAIFNQTLLRPASTTNQMSLASSSVNKTNFNNLNGYFKMQHHHSQQPMSFTNNSSIGADSPNYNRVHEDDGQLFISVGRFSPSSRFDFGTVFCRAENAIGRQKEPCTFHLLPAGPPTRLENCLVSNHSLTSLVVYCTNELINLDKYPPTVQLSNQLNNQLNSQISSKLSSQQLINQQHVAHHAHPNGAAKLLAQQNTEAARRNLYMAIVYEAQTEQLVLNLTRKQPYFVLSTLKPATQYAVLLYAINEQGRSPVHRLHTATLGPPEKRQMSQSSDPNDETPADFILFSLRQGWLAAAFASFAIILLVIILTVHCALRSRRTAANFGKEPDVIQHNSNLKLSFIKGICSLFCFKTFFTNNS